MSNFEEHNISEIKSDLQDIQNKYVRICSDYSNLKKRSEKEREEIENSTTINIIKQFLPILDALNTIDEKNSSEELSEGLSLLKENINYVISNLGVEEIPGIGSEFNPKWHEAISIKPRKNDKEIRNVITKVFIKGYKIDDKVIRQSMVEVLSK